MSKFLRHTACPSCGSQDNLAVYDDHEYCFSQDCGYYKHYGGDTIAKPKEADDAPVKEIVSLTVKSGPIKERGIDSSTTNKYKVTTDYNDDVEAIFPRFDEEGQHVANQIRLGDKQFRFQGDNKAARLFGQNLFPAGGKSITITEGYYDTLSAFQMTGSRYPNVGVMSASTAKKEVVNSFEYLNSFEEIVINFDNDEPGQKAAKDCAVLFDPGKVRILCLQKYKDANDYLVNGETKAFINEWFRAPPYMPDGLLLGNDPNLLDEIINYKEPESIPFPWEGLNRSLYGLRLGELTLFTADTGVGKALPLDTPIPTPKGWTTMGELQVGDKLFAIDGTVTEVVRTTGIMYNHDCYKVCFDDGTEVVADADHNWLVSSHKERLSGETSVRTTLEMMGSLHLSGGRSNYSIPVSGPLKTPEDSNLGVPPYTLGAWLGDGSSYSGLIYGDDSEVFKNIEADGYEVSKKQQKYTYKVKSLRWDLKAVGVLGDKHIPEEYLRASAHQRMALLQGLMDTDGYISKSGCCQYSSISKKLAEGVLELCLSLGFKTTMKEGVARLYDRGISPNYTITFTTRQPVFRLSRKLSRIPAGPTNGRATRRYVTDIVKVPSVPVKCIQVSHPTSTFLCGKSMVPTHNTTFMKEIEYALLTNEELIQRGYGVGFMHLEEPKRDTAIGLMSIYKNKPLHLPDVEKSKEELVEAYNAVINNDRVVIYDHFGSNDIDVILAKVRHMSALGCKYIVLDHLSIIVSDQSGDERKQLDEISTKLKTLTLNLNICLVCVIHINRQGQVRGSAGPEQVANNVVRLERDKKEVDEWRRNITKLTVEKCRLSGKTGPAAWVNYNSMTGRLEEIKDRDLINQYESGGSIAGHEFSAYDSD